MAVKQAQKQKKKWRFPLLQKGTRYGGMDLTFLVIVMSLLVIGILMMFSASYVWAISEGQSGSYYQNKQMINAAIGLALMFIFCVIDYHILLRPLVAICCYIIPVLLLVVVLIPGIGFTDGGATRWIAVGGFNFQPSELMKIGMIIFFAYYAQTHQESMRTFRKGILPLLLAFAVVAVLLLKEPHISATMIIGAICLLLIFIGGCNGKQMGILFFGSIIAGALILWVMYNNYDYVHTRFFSWQHPEADSQDQTWQTWQSLVAIGSGGWFGLGLGESRQKYLYLPETKNDFVFSIVCEELGFVGAMLVILLFLFLLIRGLNIAMHAKDRFGMMLATGLTVHIVLQAALNIAVVSNSIPNTGVSLPFFSYGGTALILQLLEMGIVLNISRTRYHFDRKKKTQPVQVATQPEEAEPIQEETTA